MDWRILEKSQQEILWRNNIISGNSIQQTDWFFHFFQEKEEFVKLYKKPEGEAVSADEMSLFYKSFLDKNRKMHIYYNISWYLKNFELLFLALQVNLEKGIRKLQRK